MEAPGFGSSPIGLILILEGILQIQGVAQLGRASGLGPLGREFKSLRPDLKCFMRKVIWKHEVKVSEVFTLSLPHKAEILCVAMQGGKPRLWEIHEADNVTTEVRQFVISGTGHPFSVNPTDKYLGTFQMNSYVWHLFERVLDAE